MASHGDPIRANSCKLHPRSARLGVGLKEVLKNNVFDLYFEDILSGLDPPRKMRNKKNAEPCREFLQISIMSPDYEEDSDF